MSHTSDKKAIVLYMHVHQPFRIRHYTIFDSGVNHNYFDAPYDDDASNERIAHKVAEKSYLPTNARLLQLLRDNPQFKLSLSITGTIIEQLEKWAPDALKSFQELTATGRVEIVAETYHHSLAFFYSRAEFERQVQMHADKVREVFGQEPKVFRWLGDNQKATNFDLFMDYETFGEHQWESTGIFDFLTHLPGEWLKNEHHTFMTVSEAADAFEPVDYVDVPNTITWADTERDLSAWLGNSMQTGSIQALYDLESRVLGTGDLALIEDWRRLTTSDHFYYMCTKYFNDGDIHAYFSPYKTPYEAYINFMNAYHDIQVRLVQKGVEV
jgi:alpha-amylase/alpha-mannosidase (GH57 family)